MAIEKTRASKALDALEAGLNELLLHTGSVFSEAASCDDWTIFRPALQTKQALPKTLATFQDALDYLESELVRAQAVMLNDGRAHRHQGPAQVVSSENAILKENPLAPAATDSSDAMVLDSEQPATAPKKDVLKAQGFSPKADLDLTTTISPSAINATRKEADMGETAEQAAASPTPKSTKGSASKGEPAKKEDADQGLFSDSDKNAAKDKAEPGATPLATDPKQLQPTPKEPAADKAGPTTANSEANSLLSGVELYANSNGNDALEGIGNLDEFSTSNVFGDEDLMDRISASNDPTGQDSFDAAAFTDSMFQELNNDDMNDMDNFLYGNFGADETDAVADQSSLDVSQFDDTFFNIDSM